MIMHPALMTIASGLLNVQELSGHMAVRKNETQKIGKGRTMILMSAKRNSPSSDSRGGSGEWA